MPKYDVLAIDIDGTLLNTNHEIPPAHLEAVREADAAGVRIVLASGRMLPSVTVVGEQMGIRPGPCVGYNGGRVCSAETGEVLFHEPVPADLAQELVRRFTDLGMHINYYLDDVLYVDHIEQWGNLYSYRTGSQQVPVGPLRQFDGRTPTKILIIDDPERIKGICPEFQREFGDRLYVTITTPEYLEFMNKAVDKATGVAEAVASLGVPRERTAAVGDALNDQPMIEWAGLGCAMGNADPPVLAAADVVVPSNDEDGLAWFIREYVL